MLSSDVLEDQFGPTAVEVLHQSGSDRIIRTRVISSNQTLELSWVTFRPKAAELFPTIHTSIRAGASMGKAFQNAGIAFLRQPQAIVQSPVPAVLSRYFGNGKPATILEVTVLVGPDKAPYADILEVYSPAVKWPQPPSPPDQNILQARLDQFAERLVDIG